MSASASHFDAWVDALADEFADALREDPGFEEIRPGVFTEREPSPDLARWEGEGGALWEWA